MALRILAASLLSGAFLAGASLPLPAQAQEEPPRALELTPVPIDTFTLDNGLRVIVSEDHSVPVVSVEVWYDVGSAHEEEGRSGFAHLFEHLTFEEGENLDEGQFRSLLEAAGAERNGTTNTDRTAYYETLPANRVNLALWLEAERMQNLRVTEAGFENQREIVKEERRQRVDNQPYARAQLVLDTLATDYGPYGHSVIGSMEDLDAAGIEDVRAFYERWYVPNNATLVLVGDVDPAEMREMVEGYFGDIPRGPEPPELPPPPATPRTDGERRVEVDDPLAQLPLIYMAYNVPPVRHEDSPALQILSSVFSSGESSRLYRRLVKEEQKAPVVVSFLDVRKGPGLFYFGTLPNPGGDVAELEAIISEEIERLKAGGITPRELRKAKNQIRSGEVTGRLRVSSKASDLQWYRFHFADPFRFNAVLDAYETVTPDDIRRVAGTYLVPENRTVVVARPAGGQAASTGTSSGAGQGR